MSSCSCHDGLAWPCVVWIVRIALVPKFENVPPELPRSAENGLDTRWSREVTDMWIDDRRRRIPKTVRNDFETRGRERLRFPVGAVRLAGVAPGSKRSVCALRPRCQLVTLVRRVLGRRQRTGADLLQGRRVQSECDRENPTPLTDRRRLSVIV